MTTPDALPDGEVLAEFTGKVLMSYSGPSFVIDDDGREALMDDGIDYQLDGAFPAVIAWLPGLQRDGQPFEMGSWKVRCIGRGYIGARLGWVVDLVE